MSGALPMPLPRRPKLFKYRHFQPDIILLCLRWYLRSSLSYRDLEEMMAEWGLFIDHTTIYRWVQHYAPILRKLYDGKEMPCQAQAHQRLLASRRNLHHPEIRYWCQEAILDSTQADDESC